MIFFNRNVWGIIPVLVSPCVTYVHINRIAVAVQFPYTGDRNIIPPLVVEVLAEKIQGSFIGIPDPVEFPESVKGQVI